MGEPLFLGRYQAIRLLGEGGMGRVFLARQLDVGRDVVVKVLHPEHAAKRLYRQAFRCELDFLARFRHPCAVDFYEGSMDDPLGPCAVMEFVDGMQLSDLLKRHGRLSPERVGRLLGRLCGVLQAAHIQGIIHRDLKPENILVVNADTAEELPKVLDFGLAKQALAPSQGLYIPMEKLLSNTANPMIGTPAYACPEQVHGHDVDPRGDLYSLGVILYELLTGRHPFDRTTVEAMLHAHAFETPPRFVKNGGAGVPRAIEQVVLACLAKDPADRPAHARALAESYQTALGQQIWFETQDEGGRIKDAKTPDSSPVLAGTAVPEEDPTAFTFHLQAYMPEAIAVVKLRGFLNDLRGEVVESVPGLLRVRLGRCSRNSRPNGGGLLARLGLSKNTSNASDAEWYEMDVHMTKPDPNQNGKLQITVRLRPADGRPLPVSRVWQSWCARIQADLSAYLMAQ